jgi:cell division protein FtsL
MSILTPKQKRRVSLALASGAALLLLLSMGNRGCYRQARVQLERRRIEKDIHALEKTKLRLEAEKKKLDDPAEIEKLAREKYGMSKKDEKVYRVVPKEKK